MWSGLLILIVILAVVGVLLVVATLAAMAKMLLRPARMTDGKAAYVLKRLSPGDLGLAFEEHIFNLRDERTGDRIVLPAWWIPHPNAQGQCAILVHGYGDAKVGAIAWAPLFHRLGMNVLAFDLRAHGYATGGFCTAGFYERHDLNSIIDQMQVDRPNETRSIVLFGISLGAAVVAGAATLRDDLRAVILECPYADFRHAAMSHARQMGLPGPWFQRIAIGLAEKIAHADFNQVRPVDLISKIPAPLMVIQSGNDVFVTPADAQALEQATKQRGSDLGPTVYWHLSEAAHVLALCCDPGVYEQRISAFLAETTGFQKHEDLPISAQTG